MPETETLEPEKDEGRELAANIFDGAAASAAMIAAMLPEPFKAAVTLGGGIASLIGKLVRSIGVDDSAALIGELVKRADEGKITDAHVARDDAEIARLVSELYEKA